MHRQVGARRQWRYPLMKRLCLCISSDFRMPPTEDLWDCLEQASGKPIAAVMSSWTKQMGFPIIEVEEEQVSPDRPSCVPPFCVFFYTQSTDIYID